MAIYQLVNFPGLVAIHNLILGHLVDTSDPGNICNKLASFVASYVKCCRIVFARKVQVLVEFRGKMYACMIWDLDYFAMTSYSLLSNAWLIAFGFHI